MKDLTIYDQLIREGVEKKPGHATENDTDKLMVKPN